MTTRTRGRVFRILSYVSLSNNLFDSGILVLTAVFLMSCGYAPYACAESPTDLDGYVWLDVNGDQLPFQDDATIQEWLRSPNVLSREKVGRGIAGVEKLVLEHEEVRFHAAFRSVDVTVRKAAPRGVERPKKYRDAAIFESAAYELSELLGIGRVPPVVERRVGADSGTVQIWMEETQPEVVLIKGDQLHPPDPKRWLQQKQIMYLFDNLIGNSDRNQGNLLIDRSWNIWFIDHTRAFKRSSTLIYRDKLTVCERRLWKSLREVDELTLRERLEPYLESQEITKLLLRRRQIIRHIQSLIKKKGESAVLFDLRPPAAELATWAD